MDDIELAIRADQEIGRLYKDAKDFSEETPALSLTFLRGLAVAFCNVFDHDPTAQNLAEKIQSLESRQVLRLRESKLLKVLQSNGNKAAHPESFTFIKLDLPALATESLAAARALIEHVHWLKNGIVPAYTVAPVQSGALKEMCVSAMLERDVTSMYRAGTFFFERAKREPRSDAVLHANGYPAWAQIDIDHAMFWFKQAADAGQPAACFQYGHYLTQHYELDEDRSSEGERYIARAAECKNADALVYVGDASLRGSKVFAKNDVYAREVFEEAARQGHLTAVAQLGAMHAAGIGGAEDKVAAALYLLKAAKAGIPEAQYNLFVIYMKGIGVPRDEVSAIKYLEEAAEQGHPRAIYNLAILIEDGKVPGRSIEDAEREFDRAMHFDEYKARSAFFAAQLIARTSDEPSRLRKAADLLQLCYSLTVAEDPHNLNTACLKACREVVPRLRARINANRADQPTTADDIFTAALFDNACVPVVDRDERLTYLVNVLLKNGNTPSAKVVNTSFMMHEACLGGYPAPSVPRLGSPIAFRKVPAEGPKTLPDKSPATAITAGRNDRCPCGSGRKFKKCHGA